MNIVHALSFVVIVIVLVQGCNNNLDSSDDAIDDVNGVSEEQYESIGSCKYGALIFHEQIERDAGTPEESYTVLKNLPNRGEICIKVSIMRNGHSRGISAAWLELDDVSIFTPDEFNQKVDTLEKTKFIEAGDHVLNLRVASVPQAIFQVDIYYLPEKRKNEYFYMNGIESFFKNEPVDTEWATNTESEINETLEYFVSLGEIQSYGVECRSTLCLISMISSVSSAKLARVIIASDGLRSQAARQVILRSPHQSRIFFSRKGHALPQVDF